MRYSLARASCDGAAGPDTVVDLTPKYGIEKVNSKFSSLVTSRIRLLVCYSDV